MIKSKLKFLLISVLVICFLTYPLSSTMGKNPSTPDIDKVLNDSYDSVSNIQKQISLILQNYFINLVTESTSKPSTSSIKIYSNQLNTLKNQLSQYADSSLEFKQKAKLEVLLNVISSLNYMADKVDVLLNSSDATSQYILFRSILYIDTLITQTLSTFNSI